MQHYILTRFNIPYIGTDGLGLNSAKKPIHPSKLELSEQWLRSRLDIFVQYTLQSIKKQTRQAFKWFIFVDINSPIWLILELQQLVEGIGHIRFVNGFRFVGGFLDLIAQDRPLLTTRLDSDDILACDYVEIVQSSIGSSSEFLSFPNGYLFYNKLVSPFDRLRNGFVTFVEYSKQIHSVFVIPHMRIHEIAPVRVVSEIPMWCQILHTANITQLVKGKHKAKHFTTSGVRSWHSVETVRSELGQFLRG